MLLHKFTVSLVVSMIAGVACSTAQAQLTGGNGTISGTGTVSIKRPPDLLRMQVQVAVQGKDVKEAVARLKVRRDVVKAKLVELGANKDSLVLGDARASAEDQSRRRQMEMMVRERMRQQGRRAAKKEETKPVSLTADIKAEWSLPAGNAEQLLIAAFEIQQKTTAELAKLRASEETSAEDEELAEEMQQNMGFDDGQPKPGEPSFVFVARVSKEELAKSLASAYQKAKEQATQLSQVAGVKLGALENLVTHESMADFDQQFGGGFRSNPLLYRAMMQQQQQIARPDDAQTEAIGADASQVALSVSVVASFGIKE